VVCHPLARRRRRGGDRVADFKALDRTALKSF
jgi:hypothetical protein